MHDNDDQVRFELKAGAGVDGDNSPPEATVVAIERRQAIERIRKRALKAMILEKTAVWRRFLRRRLPSNA